MTEVTAVAISEIEPILTALTNQISVSSVVQVIAYVVGASVGLVFTWFGVRKLAKAITGALKGKLRF